VTTPARGYSWPPFAPGNAAAVRHGIWSSRRVDPVVEDLVAGLVAERPDLEVFPEAVQAWGRAEARCLLLADWLTEHRIVTTEGLPQGVLRYVAQFERLAIELRARLGLDPRAEAELAQTRGEALRSYVDLEALRDRGRRALAERSDTAR
jgi:hypothetical protein